MSNFKHRFNEEYDKHISYCERQSKLQRILGEEETTFFQINIPMKDILSETFDVICKSYSKPIDKETKDMVIINTIIDFEKYYKKGHNKPFLYALTLLKRQLR